MRGFRHILPLLLLAAIGLGVWRSGLLHELSWHALARHQSGLLALVSAHPVTAAALYVGLYTLVVAFSVPEAAVVTVAGGLLFGTLLGGTLAVLGSTLGAIILFLVARTALADVVARRARTVIERIRPRLHRDGFSYLLALRLVPAIPFWLVNLGAALCGMRLFPYTAATLIGIIPATFIFASIGDGVGAVLAAGGKPDVAVIFSPRFLAPLLALAVLSLTP
ncbi:MAG: TVP38/TMEM64 family protein, partial [Acetobacteraceae bacterium]